LTRTEQRGATRFEAVLDEVSRLPAFERAYGALTRAGRAAVGGLWGSSFSLLVAALERVHAGTSLVLVPSASEAEDLVRDLRLLGGSRDAVRALAPMEGPDGGAVSDPRVLSRNLGALRALAGSDRPAIVVAPLPVLVRPLVSPERLAASELRAAPGDETDRDRLHAQLAEAGLDRVDLVASPGEYSVRGGIVDVFPFGEERPVRIELDGDWIDSVRRIDPSTQRSVEVLDAVTLPLLGRDGFSRPEREATLADYLAPGDRVVARNPYDLEERLDRYDDVPRAVARLVRGGAGHPRLEVHALSVPEGEGAANFDVASISAGGSDLASALGLVGGLAESNERIVLFCQSEAEGKRFGSLCRRELGALADGIEVRLGDLSEGFRFRELGLVLVDHHELFHRVRQRRRELPDTAPSLPIDDHLKLARGDLVVHVLHGIARYRGLTRMQSGEAEQEFLTLEFRGGMLVHVPISKIHLVERYVGSKGSEPRLSKLGGKGWANRKKAVEDSVTEFAMKLLRVQAIRSRRQGISFPADTEWQHEFEAAFPYKDTPDQHEASVLVKRDMESRKPMDRLICGDVGYGKTEIAMRACFKAVESGKQVAVLVPTTVLAQQHLQTFRERMSDYPVEIEVLSRFRSGREIKGVLERTRDGRVDIVIGTHRLLGKDVEFKDLGLVIVDEEQRFGVAHKEQLMSLRATVDVLTLSATPIPRTLHMALVNLRDISTLETPPQGRQAIHTRIVPFQEDLVRDAVLFELERDGQVFFIHNRVKTIEGVRDKLERLVPVARIEVVHGQIEEGLVEERMTRFVEGKIDVLLATTIIESGLDIPNANTIFIDRADRFGLAELHQLRGRVGRYKKQAHAYLLVPPRAVISSEAKKRLKAIEELSDLGAGFRIAMRDMEIRGAGNLLGPEQHGHIAAIGYELYCRLLRDAVKRLRGEAVRPRVDTDIDLGVPAFLPADFIPDTRQKVEIYQKIADARTPEAIDAVREECRDRFGAVPPELENLLWVARVRPLLEQSRIESVKRRGSRLILTLPVGYLPPGLRGRSLDQVRRVDPRTVHLLLPPSCCELQDVVPGLERALSGRGFF